MNSNAQSSQCPDKQGVQRSQEQGQARPAPSRPQLGATSQHRERHIHIPVRQRYPLCHISSKTHTATSSKATSASSAYATSRTRASSPSPTSPTSPPSSSRPTSHSSTSRPHVGRTPTSSSTPSSSAQRRRTRTRARRRTWTSSTTS
jgi:hypothetical protein